MDKALIIVARIMMAQLFIVAGIQKIQGYARSQSYFGTLGLPMPEILVPLVIALEIGGGLALLFGLKMRCVAAALAIFTIATALVAHSNFSVQGQMVQFMKNIAIASGLLLFVRYGAGRPSIDDGSRS